MKSSTKGGLLISVGVIALLLMFAARLLSIEASGDLKELYNTAATASLIIGILGILIGIAFIASSNAEVNQDNSKASEGRADSLFVICSNCGEENGKTRTHCYKCGASLMPENREQKSDLNTGCWTCPKCGKVNASYVGTCGCGVSKPR